MAYWIFHRSFRLSIIFSHSMLSFSVSSLENSNTMNLLPKLEDWKWFGISLSLFDPIYPINTQVHQFFLPFITFSPPHPIHVSPTENHCSHCFTLTAATISKWPPSLSLTISQFALHTASRTVFPKMQIWSWHPPSSNSSMTPHSHQDKAHSWVWYGGLSCSHLSAVTPGALCITCPVLAVPHVYYAHMHPHSLLWYINMPFPLPGMVFPLPLISMVWQITFCPSKLSITIIFWGNASQLGLGPSWVYLSIPVGPSP